ncbi:MAG: hypothetical protein ACTH2Y_04360 [Corynebacterium sp.]|uniref:hypothetical protein n=1 Tax=unclassified Corynebacterium TaxID=2624378 RepID=UPI0026482D5D|nr:hypothetical protein [Corynebacterium sp.]MDN5581622.1 hypothetical protein [Corynebacterium sp.]MDN5720580.1 hypothetical protein [Corynebacterium sp.]MDN6259888.1 hypothetical protein [Corynebacterium sp.]MDN6325559.1 hypothetical protein [Corynebacterium sp.]
MTTHTSEDTANSGPGESDESNEAVRQVARFALSEDWAAVVAGLGILVLVLAGVITESWLVL